MILHLTPDKKYFTMEYEAQIEYEQFRISLNRDIRNKFAIRKRKGKGRWDGKVNFIHPGERIKSGMWREVEKICKENNMAFKVNGLGRLYNGSINIKEVEAFCVHLAANYCPKIKPRPDQIDALYRMIKYENCLCDLGTSAGKTFIIFCYCVWQVIHKKKFNKILIICHDADNVLQFAENFREYSGGNRIKLKIGLIYGDGTVKNDVDQFNVVIGNFQTLRNREDQIFEKFKCLIVDECITGDAILETTTGRKRLDEVQINDIVQSGDEQGNIVWDKVVNKWERGERKVYKITLSDGSSLKCTGNHRLFTNYGWLTVDDILDGEFVSIVLYRNDSQYIPYEEKHRTIDIGQHVGRYEHVLSTLEQYKSKNKSKSFFETARSCDDEIRDIKAVCADRTENNNKSGIRRIFKQIWNKMSSGIKEILQSLSHRQEESSKHELAKSSNRRRPGVLVHGRWWFDRKRKILKNSNLFIQPGGELLNTRVSQNKMGYSGECSNGEGKILWSHNAIGEQEQICKDDITFRDRINGLQIGGHRSDSNMHRMHKRVQSGDFNDNMLFERMHSEESEEETKRTLREEQSNLYSPCHLQTIKELGTEKVYDIETENTHTFFANGILVHNCQKAGNVTIQNIIKAAKNVTSAIGLSGTILEDKTADYYLLLASFGPIVARITQRQLMDIGAATPVKIEIMILNYPASEQRTRLMHVKKDIKDGETKLQEIDLYNMELNIIRQDARRLDWICDLISKLVGNTLVLFLDVKGGYGRMIEAGVKARNARKETYYIDGDVDTKLRGVFKKRMEEGNNKVLVATYDTFGTGKSVNNIHYIVLAEPRKGYNVIGQMIGRGMRLHESKEFYTIIDIADNLSIEPDYYFGISDDNKYKSILMKQKDARVRLYVKGQFDYTIRTIHL